MMIINSDQELFVDEDEGDDNANSDEELHCEKSVACATKCGSLVLNAVRNSCEKFSLWHGLTKNLGGNATVKDFFNKFLDNDYLDLNCLLCHSVPLIQKVTLTNLPENIPKLLSGIATIRI